MISSTAHISFTIDTLMFVDKMFRELNLTDTIAPLKVKGIKLTVIVRAMISYKLAVKGKLIGGERKTGFPVS